MQIGVSYNAVIHKWAFYGTHQLGQTPYFPQPQLRHILKFSPFVNTYFHKYFLHFPHTMSTDKTNAQLDKIIEQTSQLTSQIIQQDKQTSQLHTTNIERHAELLKNIKDLSQSTHTTQTRTLQLNVDPNFPIFDYRSKTIKEWIQETHERSQVLNLPETSKVLYAKIAMPQQIGHLQGATSNTTWSEFVNTYYRQRLTKTCNTRPHTKNPIPQNA